MHLLTFDAFGRRVIDETFADWRHEAGAATGMPARICAHLRGLVALGRAVPRVFVHELRVSETWAVMASVFGVAFILAVLWSGLSLPGLLSRNAGLEQQALDLWLLLVPQYFFISLLLAVLSPPFVRRTSGVALAPMLLLTLVMASALQWGIPDVLQQFRVTVWRSAVEQLGPPTSPTEALERTIPPSRGLNELSLTELVNRARSADESPGRGARGQLAMRSALVALLPALWLLGVQTRRLADHWRWRAGRWALAWVSAGVVFAVTVLLDRWLRHAPLLRDWAWVRAPGFNLWLFVAGVVAVTDRLSVSCIETR